MAQVKDASWNQLSQSNCNLTSMFIQRTFPDFKVESESIKRRRVLRQCGCAIHQPCDLTDARLN